MAADMWFEPELVIEIVASEITQSPIHKTASDKIKENTGLALRFPKFTGKIRTEKNAEDASTDEEVIEAAKLAHVHKNIIKFNNGYETILGERGITLSGGQKQRISIARALIKDPEILLFDDCLSAVDTETEEKILNNLNQVTKGKTTIIVGHRVSSAKNADKIIIIEDGMIVQEGTHDTLVNVDGYYKHLYLKQLSENSSVNN